MNGELRQENCTKIIENIKSIWSLIFPTEIPIEL